ncbi:unnamed protein product [Phytophthora lilii]|uniref:Unnamed protein product n=1 Tax=Phytophthora lilii TaxID=2077276 RepID=A0A9W6TEE1_9STRA|nr:unnamed protein product [Phytophthora lilii]
MDLLGRSLPKFWDSKPHVESTVTGIVNEHQGPSASVLNNRRRGGTVGERNAAGYLYELQLAHPLPIVDISRTPLSLFLPPSIYSRAVQGMHKANWLLVWLNRVNVVLFGFMVFSPAALMRSWMPFIGTISLVTPLCFILFLSLEVLALLRQNYEFWFILVLSTITWVGLGQIFGDSRAVTCVSLWLSSFMVVSIDANYRTYQTTVKSIIVAGPSIMTVVVCSAYKLIPDSNFPTQSIGALTLQSRQVVIFTASTLVIFMYKKAYLRVRRARGLALSRERTNFGDERHTISCVVLSARMRLVPVIFKQQLRLGAFVRSQVANALSAQQLRLALHGSVIVDSRRILLSEEQLQRFVAPCMQAALYVIAMVGLAATATSWILVLYQSEQHSLVIGAIAAGCSLLFALSTVVLAQRDLLHLLAWNFDVLFSTFQATTLALCLIDMLNWNTSSSLAVVAWWFWFHWILLLDALTPSVAPQLQLRKLALPILLLVLPIAAVCAVEILTSDGKIFTSRLLLNVRLPKMGTFEVYTDTLAVQRIVTIIGWNARLVLELALCDPGQLLFIRRPIEYISPFFTFTEPLSTDNQPKSTGVRRWRRKLARSSDIVPISTLHTEHDQSLATSERHKSPTSTHTLNTVY